MYNEPFFFFLPRRFPLTDSLKARWLCRASQALLDEIKHETTEIRPVKLLSHIYIPGIILLDYPRSTCDRDTTRTLKM